MTVQQEELTYSIYEVPDLRLASTRDTYVGDKTLPPPLEQWVVSGMIDGDHWILTDPWVGGDDGLYGIDVLIPAFIMRYAYLQERPDSLTQLSRCEHMAMDAAEQRRGSLVTLHASSEQRWQDRLDANRFADQLGDQIRQHAVDHDFCSSYEAALADLHVDAGFQQELLRTFIESAERMEDVEYAVVVNITTPITLNVTVSKRRDEDPDFDTTHLSDLVESSGYYSSDSDWEISDYWVQ